jgi:hypothetical protein
VEKKKNNDASDEDESGDSDEDEDLSFEEGDDDVSCGINNGFLIKGQLPHADDLCTDLGFE